MNHHAPPFKYTGFKMPAAEVDALAAYARLYGRSLDAELKLAVRLLLREHALVAIERDPEGIVARGHDAEADRAEIERQLAEMRAHAFSRAAPQLLDLLADAARWN